jgi:hypothetical protein
LIPLDHPYAPKHWRGAPGGELARVVTRYLNGHAVKEEDVYLMRVYLWQWVKSPVWAPSGVLKDLRLRVAAIADTADVRKAIGAMVELGMDPL